jgi:hypothetical protein
MQAIQVTTIKFPENQLKPKDAHKLRGYFGNLFKEHSPLLHNHLENGSFRYQYPLVQYKVIDNIPLLVGINEGGKLLVDLFLQIKEIQINGQTFPVYEKNIMQKNYHVAVDNELHQYTWKTYWMGLNQENYKKYRNLSEQDKKRKLESIIKGNILSFCKAIEYKVTETIMVKTEVREQQSQFKNNTMTVFSGSFISNVSLPDYIGMGKAVSRGFGTIKKV